MQPPLSLCCSSPALSLFSLSLFLLRAAGDRQQDDQPHVWPSLADLCVADEGPSSSSASSTVGGGPLAAGGGPEEILQELAKPHPPEDRPIVHRGNFNGMTLKISLEERRSLPGWPGLQTINTFAEALERRILEMMPLVLRDGPGAKQVTKISLVKKSGDKVKAKIKVLVLIRHPKSEIGEIFV
ncbi:hypothetical protein Emed_006014 [Eimeria media]